MIRNLSAIDKEIRKELRTELYKKYHDQLGKIKGNEMRSRVDNWEEFDNDGLEHLQYILQESYGIDEDLLKMKFEFATQITKQEIKSKPHMFDFEKINPNKEIVKIEDLQKVITQNFPSVWFETKACLAATATLALKNLNGCPSLVLVGNPSGEKTTILGFFYGHEQTYLTDDFTPKSFVSHSTNVKAEELKNIDLLPKIKDHALISPELAPLFEAPKDKLIENFAILTRVLDGEGLNRDTGTHGHRGYSGDYKFVWLGATTPLRSSVWSVMGKIGNRLFFLNMKEKNRTNTDYLAMFQGKAYEEKIKECRGAVHYFLDNLFKTNGIRAIEWNPENDILFLPEIIKYAKFLSKLRASLMTWRGEERGDFGYNFPIIEEPPRAINALYNFAKGNAIIHGRRFLKAEDLAIVRSVCFASMPHDRFKFLQLLTQHDGRLTTQQIEKELGCSTQTATRTMKTFEVLGIVTIKSIQVDYSGRPMHYIEINPEYAELLTQAHGGNHGINTKFHKTIGESNDYDALTPKDFVKTIEEKVQVQQENNGRNGLFQKNIPLPIQEKKFVSSTDIPTGDNLPKIQINNSDENTATLKPFPINEIKKSLEVWDET